MPPFNFEESYKKPEDTLPQEIAEVKAHPEMVGFDKEAMRKKLEKQSVFEFDKDTDLGQMESMAREDEIDVEMRRAEQEHKYFINDFERGIKNYYEEVGLRPEKDFKEQFHTAVRKVAAKIDIANNYLKLFREENFTAVALEFSRVPKTFISCEYGKFYKVTFVKKNMRLDLNEFGFPGSVDLYLNQLILNNNAGVLGVSSLGDSKEYHYEGLRDAMNTQRGWNSIEVVGMTKDEVSIEEVKHILAAQPGLFKELYEKIKAKKLLEIRNEKRAREK